MIHFFFHFTHLSLKGNFYEDLLILMVSRQQEIWKEIRVNASEESIFVVFGRLIDPIISI